MSNPYEDQEPYGAAWGEGYQYGLANPEEGDPSPPDFTSWGYDEETTANAAQVWREGALAGREATQAAGRTMPFYDEANDTLYVNAEEFPALVTVSQADDVDTWLRGLGIDPASLTDDEPVA